MATTPEVDGEREMNISMESNEHKTHTKVTWLLLS